MSNRLMQTLVIEEAAVIHPPSTLVRPSAPCICGRFAINRPLLNPPASPSSTPMTKYPMRLPNGWSGVAGEPGINGRSCGLNRSEEHTSELQSLMRTSYAVLCLKKKKTINHYNTYKIGT